MWGQQWWWMQTRMAMWQWCLSSWSSSNCLCNIYLLMCWYSNIMVPCVFCSPHFIFKVLIKYLKVMFQICWQVWRDAQWLQMLTLQLCRTTFWSPWGLAGSPWNQDLVGHSLALTSFPIQSSLLDSSRYNYLCISTIPNRQLRHECICLMNKWE